MNYLILYAHPNKNSLNAALLKNIKRALEEKRHTVCVRNLYELSFDPILSAEDLKTLAAGGIPEDLRQEQEYVRNADVVLMIYPIWWAGMPAILKGYIDRVFSYGFAYSYRTDGTVEGLLAGKKGFIINTMGASEKEYEESGMLHSLVQTSNENIFIFTGIEPSGHLFFGEVPDAGEEKGQRILEKAIQKVLEIS